MTILIFIFDDVNKREQQVNLTKHYKMTNKLYANLLVIFV